MNKKVQLIIYLLISSLALIIPALINHFPIVYSDTATYIVSGFQLRPPFDRPLTYGIFLRLASINGLTLWTVIGLQSMLFAYLIHRVIRKLIPDLSGHYAYSFFVILIVSLLTGVSWMASQLIPDIFTPILFLTSFLLLMERESISDQVFLYFVFFISTAMHIGHLSYNITFLAGVLIIRQLNVFQVKSRIRLIPVLIMVALTLSSILTMGAALSKSKHVFFMGAMVEHGILETYLDENCDTENYKLCAYKDSLPKYAWQFIWDEKSPFYKVGGWKNTKEEFNEIIWNSFTSPRYISLHIKESIKATADQLTKFKIGDGNGPFTEATSLYEIVKKFFPHEISEYSDSHQNRQKLNYLKEFNYLQQWVTGLSFLILIVFLFLKRNYKGYSSYFVFVVLTLYALLINAWVSGTFANAIDRLGAKMMWMVLFLVLVGVLNNIASKSVDR